MIAQAAMYPAQPVADTDGLINFIFTLTATQLEGMKQHGLHMFHKLQFPNTLIWIPAGWLVFERTSSEQLVGSKFSGFDAHRPTLVNLKLLREGLQAKDSKYESQQKTLAFISSKFEDIDDVELSLPCLAYDAKAPVEGTPQAALQNGKAVAKAEARTPEKRIAPQLEALAAGESAAAPEPPARSAMPKFTGPAPVTPTGNTSHQACYV